MATRRARPAPALPPLADAWLATCSSANTRDAYRRDVQRFVEWCERTGRDPMDVDRGDVDDYRDDCLAEGASRATVGRRLSGVSSFFAYLTSVGEVPANPVTDVDRPSSAADPQGALDDTEIDALLESATQVGPKSAALIGMLVLDGMKLNETLALDVGDVKLSARTATVTVSRRGERQPIRLQPTSAHAVAEHIGGRRRGPLFLGDSAVKHRPTRLTRFGADYLIKKAARTAGIDRPVSANSLRRSYVQAEQRAGTQLETIASQVGHQHVRETRRMLETTVLSAP